MDSIGPKMSPGLEIKQNISVRCLEIFASCKILNSKMVFYIPLNFNYDEASGPYLIPSLSCLLTPVQSTSNIKSLAVYNTK